MSKVTVVILSEELFALHERLRQLFGSERMAEKIALSLRVHVTTVHRWLSGESKMPGYASGAIDLLEVCPRQKWPAHVHKALALKDERRAG